MLAKNLIKTHGASQEEVDNYTVDDITHRICWGCNEEVYFRPI